MSDATGSGQEYESSTSSSSVQWSPPLCRHFEFQEIQLATDDFDESLVIGRGGFGKVYRGTIYDGSTPVDAAIKRLDFSSSQGAPEFWAEVEMLSKLRHCHLVSLFGYCKHEKEMILVYEYMLNGTLADHLHKLGTALSWFQRLDICIGAARGLHYLHTGTGIESGVIHRDVKSSNILLNESWAAKISDFGLSRIAPTNRTVTGVSTLVKGTFGYFDPDYYSTGRLTRKSDVYAFGVVLLEILCRKRAIDESLGEDQPNLARWAQESIKEGNLKHIIDSDIRGEISPKCMKEFVRITERCLISNPKQRSTMAEVVVGLESILTLPEKLVTRPLQAAHRTLFGRMVYKFSFPFKGENSAQGDLKPPHNTKRNSTSEGYRIQILNELKFTGSREFKFADLKKATSNFHEDMILGRGSYAQVYLGWVDEDTFAPSLHGVGNAVAVKRFRQTSNEYEFEGWVTEVKVLRRLSHPNIISLLGFCGDNKLEHLLVYEYMPNQSFDLIFHGMTPHHNIGESLSWGTRLAIMIGVARGLAYLHLFKVVHRDVKGSNILLDQDFNPKLGGFRIAKACNDNDVTHATTRVAGSVGYLDPYYMQTCRVSLKSDIYSFGVLLLETLTGCKPLVDKQPEGPQHLVTWAAPFLAEESELQKIMDPRLKDNYPIEGAFECAVLAQRCTSLEPNDRPSSDEVLRSLEQIYAAQR